MRVLDIVKEWFVKCNLDKYLSNANRPSNEMLLGNDMVYVKTYLYVRIYKSVTRNTFHLLYKYNMKNIDILPLIQDEKIYNITDAIGLLNNLAMVSRENEYNYVYTSDKFIKSNSNLSKCVVVKLLSQNTKRLLYTIKIGGLFKLVTWFDVLVIGLMRKKGF